MLMSHLNLFFSLVGNQGRNNYNSQSKLNIVSFFPDWIHKFFDLMLRFFFSDVSIGFGNVTFQFEESSLSAVLTLLVDGELGRDVSVRILTLDDTAIGT